MKTIFTSGIICLLFLFFVGQNSIAQNDLFEMLFRQKVLENGAESYKPMVTVKTERLVDSIQISV